MKPCLDFPLADLRYALCGFLMGSADIVPGVSGGTVALIVGVYERLLAAISRFDAVLIRMLLRRNFAEAAAHVDLRFLAALGGGVAVAIVSLAKLLDYLMRQHTGLTFAVFFGLILASSIIVGRMCRPQGGKQRAICLALAILAAIAAWGIVSLDHLEGQQGLGYTFFSGSIAICAMILPGVSGSYLLIVLGKYHEIIGIIKSLPKLAVTGEEIATLAVFAAGCATGLLLFSKLLRWLLASYHAPTMAVLCGLMIGSLKKVWPFQTDTTPDVEKFKEKVFVNNWSPELNGHTYACIALAAAALVLVLAFDALGRRKAAAPEAESAG